MQRVADRPELLDGPLDHDLLDGNLRDLARVNRWLGGVALSRRALVTLVTGRHAYPRVGRSDWRRETIRFLDVGTGGADIPAALLAWTRDRGLRLEVEAVDTRHEVLDIALERVGEPPGLRLDHTPFDRLPYDDGAFDITHVSLVLHHLDPPAAVRLLRELARTARLGVIVNDLDRTQRSLAGAWLLSRIATRNPYTRHDAPLSVRRAYRPAEVAEMATEAGLMEVTRQWGFLGHRYVMAFVHARRGGPDEPPATTADPGD